MPMRRIVVPCAFQQCLSFGTVTLAAVRCLSASETITKNMPNKAVYFLAIDGFADWEPAHALAELRRHGAYRVETVGLSREAVVSMGGLRVLPSCRIADVDPDDVAVFIMPGGDRWETRPIEGELESKLKELEYLRSHVSAYREEQHYVAAPAVRDSGLITASGVADVEFARELFDELGMLSEGDRAAWTEMFRSARLPGDAS